MCTKFSDCRVCRCLGKINPNMTKLGFRIQDLPPPVLHDVWYRTYHLPSYMRSDTVLTTYSLTWCRIQDLPPPLLHDVGYTTYHLPSYMISVVMPWGTSLLFVTTARVSSWWLTAHVTHIIHKATFLLNCTEIWIFNFDMTWVTPRALNGPESKFFPVRKCLRIQHVILNNA
jgi:hypothetical protein